MNIQAVNPRQVFTNITAGLITGLLFVVLSISLATLIFNGDMEPFLSRGIGLFLFSAVALAVVVALLGKFHGFVVPPQDAPAALLAVAAGGIASALTVNGNPEAIFPTVAAGIIICSLVTGLVFFLIGRFNLGNLVRFIPYPVVGGFLAGTGWLLTRGSFEVMIGHSLSSDVIPLLFSSEMLIRWLPGTIFAIIVLVIIRRVNHYLVWPSIIFSGLLIFYLALLGSGSSLDEARSAGLLLEALPSGGLWAPFTSSAFTKVDWGGLASQLDKFIPIPLVSLVSFLLNATGLELVAKRDIDLNHELRVTGMANMLAGLGGGPAGYMALGATSLAQRMGAKTPIVTITAASVCGTVLLFGGRFISYLPVALLSSLLLVLGLSFLVDWLYDGWFKLPKSEYFLVVISLAMIASIGFLQGITIGIFAATILFVFKYSRVNTVRDTLNGRIYRSKVDRPVEQRDTLREFGENIHIYRLQGYIFFGTSDNLYTRLRTLLEDNTVVEHFVLLDFQRVHGFDSSAVSSFTRMYQMAIVHNIFLVVTHVSPEIRQQMELGGFKEDEYVHFFPTLDYGMEWCENKLLQRHERSTQFLQKNIKSQLSLTFPKPDLVEKLLTYMDRIEMEKDNYLLRKNETPDAMYFIESGRLTVYLDTNDGDMVRIRSIRSGTVVGEMGLYLRNKRTASVYTEQKTVLYRLEFEKMKQMEADDPDVASALHEWLGRQLAERIADDNLTIEALMD